MGIGQRKKKASVNPALGSKDADPSYYTGFHCPQHYNLVKCTIMKGRGNVWQAISVGNKESGMLLLGYVCICLLEAT